VYVTFDGVQSAKLPIRSISVSWKGKGTLRQVIDVGYQGTSPAEREKNILNEIIAAIKNNQKGLSVRSIGVNTGSTAPHPKLHASNHHPSGIDELLLDEDDMATDSATKGTSQQAAKAYSDNKTPKHGFENHDDTTLSFTDGTRTLNLTRVNDFTYWINGTKYTKTATDTVQIDDTEGIWYIYYSGSTLTASQTPWSITDLTVIPVAIVYWDATNNVALTDAKDERHLYTMSPATHNNLHHTRGATFESGFGLTQGAGGDAGKIALEGGEIHDEDIEILVVDGAGSGRFEQELGLADPFAAAQIPVFYRSGASAWRKYTAGDYPFYDNAGADNVHYNAEAGGSWSSTASASAAKYLATWIFCTNDWVEPVIAIMGQNESNTLAQAKVADTLNSLQLGGLVTPEMKVLYRIIYKSDGTISDVVEFRDNTSGPAGSFTATAHDSLTGLTTDNHHPQLHAADHSSGGTDEVSHDDLADFVIAEHLSLPNTTANVLSDHDKAAHDALNIDADTIDSIDSTGLVQTSGNQTVAGNKTFSGIIYLANGVVYYLDSAGDIKVKDISADYLDITKAFGRVDFSGIASNVTGTVHAGDSEKFWITNNLYKDGSGWHTFDSSFMGILVDMVGSATVPTFDIYSGTAAATPSFTKRFGLDLATGYISTLGGFNTDIKASGNKTLDIGETGVAFDNIYADDFVNESAWKNFDDPLAIIMAIKGKIDQLTGKEKLDHSSTPDWTRTTDKVKKTRIVTDTINDGEQILLQEYWDHEQSEVRGEGTSINRLQCIIIQAIQKLKEEIDLLKQ
jgi:hypothetical protein